MFRVEMTDGGAEEIVADRMTFDDGPVWFYSPSCSSGRRAQFASVSTAGGGLTRGRQYGPRQAALAEQRGQSVFSHDGDTVLARFACFSRLRVGVGGGEQLHFLGDRRPRNVSS